MASGQKVNTLGQKTPNTRKKKEKCIPIIYFPNSISPTRNPNNQLLSRTSFSHSNTTLQNRNTGLRSSLRRNKTIISLNSSILDTITLNIGGNIFVTTKTALSREKLSFLCDIEKKASLRDSENRIFVDRDGNLFEHILRYLETGVLHLPETFHDFTRLQIEAKYYKLTYLSTLIENYKRNANSRRAIGTYITITTHANYKIICRDLTETAFHRIASMTIAGHVQSCKLVFGNHLCMDRDSNIEQDRYSCRMILKNLSISSAFEVLQKHNYALQTSKTIGVQGHFNVHKKNKDHEKWIHTNLYVFMKDQI